MKLVVHDGPFQADEVFAVAFLIMYHPGVKETLPQRKETYLKQGILSMGYDITRTRKQSIIDAADIVCDVGGVYNSTNQRFDHHHFKKPEGQDYVIPKGLHGTWHAEAKITPSSCGLVLDWLWHYHESKKTGDLPIYLANRFFKRLVLGIDGIDCGIQQVEDGVKLRYRPCTISNLIASKNADDCFEDKHEQLKRFHRALDLALDYLEHIDSGYWRDEYNFETVKDKATQQSGNHLVFDKFYPGWLSMLSRAKVLHKFKRIIWPTLDGEGQQEYRVQVPPVDLGQNKFICKYPGLDGSKVNPEYPEGHKDEGDLVFVHENKHIGATRTMDAAYKL